HSVIRSSGCWSWVISHRFRTTILCLGSRILLSGFFCSLPTLCSEHLPAQRKQRFPDLHDVGGEWGPLTAAQRSKISCELETIVDFGRRLDADVQKAREFRARGCAAAFDDVADDRLGRSNDL